MGVSETVNRVVLVNSALEKGFKTIEEIAEHEHLHPYIVNKIINFKSNPVVPNKKEVEVKEKKSKKDRPSRKESLSKIVFLIDKANKVLDENSSWPERKACEYILKTPQRKCSYTFNLLFSVFKTYEDFLKRKEPITYTKLAKKHGLFVASISRMLKKVNLKDLKEVHYIKGWQKEMMINARMLDLSYDDISYFTGISKSVVKYHTQGILKRESPSNKTSYSLAAKVYEAKDLGFKNEEIAELLTTKETNVDYTLKNKNELEKKIILLIKEITSKDVIKPYLETI